MKYKYIRFVTDKDSNCCGIIELGLFNEEEDKRNWIENKTIPAPSFDSPVPVLEKFDVDLHNNLSEFISDDSGYNGSYLVRCSLVEKYGSLDRGQLDHLQKHLLSKGWKKDYSFVNGNSGNTVAVYSTLLTPEEVDEIRNNSEAYDDSW